MANIQIIQGDFEKKLKQLKTIIMIRLTSIVILSVILKRRSTGKWKVTQ